MPIIGNPIYQSAFVTDTFSGDGVTTAFTMAVAPAGTSNVLVVVSGVVQAPATYGVVGNTLTFSAAPPSGTGNISCRYLGVPVTGVVTTAYRTVTEFTATAGQTTFTPPSYTPNFINVYLNGVLLGSADYTATNGTTVILTSGASAGNLVTVESFRVESVANAIANAAGSVSSSNLASGIVTPAKLSTGGPYWDTSNNFAVGTTSPTTYQGMVTLVKTSAAAETVPLSVINASGSAGTSVSFGFAPNTNIDLVRLNAYRTDTGFGGATDLIMKSWNGSSLTEKMRIDSVGRMTIPNQPSFRAYTTSGTYPTTSGSVNFNNVQSNTSSSFATSGGNAYKRFTAPVAGTYLFAAALMAQDGTGRCYWGIYKNGGNIAQTGGTSTNYGNATTSIVVDMAANDYVEVVIQSGNLYSASTVENYFSGYLLG